MARFSFFVDVIDNQSKTTQPPLDIHKSNVAIIVMLSSRARRTQKFHGFVDHVKDYFIIITI